MDKEKGQEEGCCDSGCCGSRGGRKFFCGLLLGVLLSASGVGLYQAGKCAATKKGCCMVKPPAVEQTTPAK